MTLVMVPNVETKFDRVQTESRLCPTRPHGLAWPLARIIPALIKFSPTTCLWCVPQQSFPDALILLPNSQLETSLLCSNLIMNIFNPKILDASIRDVSSYLSDNQKVDLLLYAMRCLPFEGYVDILASSQTGFLLYSAAYL